MPDYKFRIKWLRRLYAGRDDSSRRRGAGLRWRPLPQAEEPTEPAGETDNLSPAIQRKTYSHRRERRSAFRAKRSFALYVLFFFATPVGFATTCPSQTMVALLAWCASQFSLYVHLSALLHLPPAALQRFAPVLGEGYCNHITHFYRRERRSAFRAKRSFAS